MNGFDRAYRGTPPWDIGRPQEAFVALRRRGEIRGDVLDVGCGTGENALYLAARGHAVWGVDDSPRAIEKARAKARERGLKATFLAADVLSGPPVDRTFDVVIDSGLFHVFSDDERQAFVDTLAALLRPGGMYFMLCFSEHEPTDWGGPRRITQEEIRSTFRDGWTVDSIQDASFESHLHPEGGRAWLSSITKR